jgi:hypothetical protein
MKPIREMSLLELAEYVNNKLGSGDDINDIIYRLCELHDLTRWIPVSERMPTEADLNEFGLVATYDKGYIDKATVRKGAVKVWDDDDESWTDFDATNRAFSFTHWQRITPPEGV